jgi:hypothetical protein
MPLPMEESKKIELFEKYFNDLLDEQEREDFKLLLFKDDSLKEAYHAYEKVAIALEKEAIRAELAQKISANPIDAVDTPISPKQNFSYKKIFLTILLASFIVLGAILSIQVLKQDEGKLIEEPQKILDAKDDAIGEVFSDSLLAAQQPLALDKDTLGEAMFIPRKHEHDDMGLKRANEWIAFLPDEQSGVRGQEKYNESDKNTYDNLLRSLQSGHWDTALKMAEEIKGLNADDKDWIRFICLNMTNQKDASELILMKIASDELHTYHKFAKDEWRRN